MADTQQYTKPRQHALDLASMIKSSLYGFNARVAAPTLETAVTSRQSVSVPPPYQQDEAAIARGHAERRLLLAQRRAEQQLTVIMSEASRLGVTLSVETLARTAIAAYVDTMKVARR